MVPTQLAAQARSPGGEMHFPAGEWVEMPAESQGVDPFKLEQAARYLASRSGTDGIRELVILSNGYLIWKGPHADRVHHTWSIAKIFTSTVLGLLADDRICTPETRVRGLVPGLAHQYPEVRLKHLAAMSSGYDAAGGAAWGNHLDGSNTPWLPADPLFKPGTAYLYWDDAANLMAHALTEAAEESMYDLFKRRIADPIGIAQNQWSWESWGEVDGYTLNQGAMGLRISAEDLARLGHLYLNRGNWNGKPLLSEAWVDDATRNRVPVTIPLYRELNADPGNYTAHMDADGRGIYGFHWWVNGVKPDGSRSLPDTPAGTFYRTGYNHNMLFVIPDWNMVIVRLGLDGSPEHGEKVWNLFLKKVGESLVDYYPGAVEILTLPATAGVAFELDGIAAPPFSEARGGGTPGQPVTVAFAVTKTSSHSKDLLSLHYDHAPDKDDGHSAAADRTLLQSLFGVDWIRAHVVPVSGAYGVNQDDFNPDSDAVMDAAWNDCGGWLAAHADRESVLAELTSRWRGVLKTGGDVWVKEGGQSDVTAEVLRRVKEGLPEVDTKKRIHVVQHSQWNENHTSEAALAYTREHSDYIRINDANAYLNTPGGDEAFVRAARDHPVFGSVWRAAFAYYNPEERLDFSDTGELLYILGIGEIGFAEFSKRFLSGE